ncbi:hypothetical protein OPT61_g9914 [Boeremia exigua]|uniref:Uncharacterized protein n=1 Tax=Boeremia exigua TaxID=749465 RepID=A0ACC2HST8_9PLEO|nr:hypothetical protein OPT61_g9914 [Boeremia exigua]
MAAMVQDDEERAGHGAEGEEALGEVGDALLDDVVGGAFCGAFVAGDAGGEAQQEDVPVEAGGLAEREFGALCDEAGHVVVEPEEDGEQDGEGDGQEDVADADVPEVDEPAAVGGGEEGLGCGQLEELDVRHLANVYEAGEEDDGEGCAVVFDELADVAREQRRLTDDAAEDLDALLQIDEGHVEAEDVAGEARDIAEGVAGVGDGEHPVEDQRPYADPAHEGEVVGAAWCDDVVDGVVEDGDGAGDAHNDQRLGGEDAEDNTAEDARKQDFIHAKTHVCLDEHVQREGKRGQDVRKVHVHRRRHNAIVPRIFPVAPEERSSSLDVVDHAGEQPRLVPRILALPRLFRVCAAKAGALVPRTPPTRSRFERRCAASSLRGRVDAAVALGGDRDGVVERCHGGRAVLFTWSSADDVAIV